MNRRQTRLPRQWLIAGERNRDKLWSAAAKLQRGSGIIVLFHHMAPPERRMLVRRVRRLAQAKGLAVVDEADGEAVRVHNVRELRRALLARAPLILLSPMFPTRSHPDWSPIPLMRAASMARLGQRRLVALGGMNARRFARIQSLGFTGWAGIDGFRT